MIMKINDEQVVYVPSSKCFVATRNVPAVIGILNSFPKQYCGGTSG